MRPIIICFILYVVFIIVSAGFGAVGKPQFSIWSRSRIILTTELVATHLQYLRAGLEDFSFVRN